MQKETIEEAADSYSSNPIFRIGTPRQDMKRGFELGAKWQQEQDKNKYSEEEVKHLIHLACHHSGVTVFHKFDKWFEKFKKK